ncbi:MAG: hypothetical protein ACFB16_17100 [Phormidesmis sp.]
MSTCKGLIGALGLSLLAMGAQLPAAAQVAVSSEPLDMDSVRQWVNDANASEITAANLELFEAPVAQTSIEASTLQPVLQAESFVPDDATLTSEAFVPEALVTETFVPEASVSEASVSEASMPEASMPEAFVPETLVSEDLAAESTVAESTVAESLVSEKSAPDNVATSEVTSTDGSTVAAIVPEAQLSAAVTSQPNEQPATEAAELALPAEDPVELAQARRRTRGTVLGGSYIGLGADFGYTGDTSFVAISKFAFTNTWSIRPAVLFGNDFGVLLPVTYDFSLPGSELGGFPVRPYVGAGASYVDSDDDDDDGDDDDSDINLLLVAGVDVPISRRFALNGQINWGVLDDSDFGATVGVGYNLGNLFQGR